MRFLEWAAQWNFGLPSPPERWRVYLNINDGIFDIDGVSVVPQSETVLITGSVRTRRDDGDVAKEECPND